MDRATGMYGNVVTGTCLHQFLADTVKSGVKRALLINFLCFWVCIYTRHALKRDVVLYNLFFWQAISVHIFYKSLSEKEGKSRIHTSMIVLLFTMYFFLYFGSVILQFSHFFFKI